MPRTIHADLLQAEIKRMTTDDQLESRLNDIFKLIEQNKRDYQDGHEACNAHAKELVFALYETLKQQLRTRFAEIESRIKGLEDRKVN